MKSWWVFPVAILVVMVSLTLSSSCGGDDDDDDDDDECEAEDINGSYLVRFTVDSDTCEEGTVGVETLGSIRVDQGSDDGEPRLTADVYFTPNGGGDEAFVFEGTVCGYQLIGNNSEDGPVGTGDCTITTQSTYNLVVDATGSVKSLSGTFTETITYAGTECPPGIDAGFSCAVEQTVTPVQ